MSRGILVLLILLAASSAYGARGTPATSVVTNVTRFNLVTSGAPFLFTATNTNLLVGQIYGLSELYVPTNSFFSSPNYVLKVPFILTNNGNDADSNLVLSLDSFSNSPGYTGLPWNYYLEVGSNVGTNYNLPFTLFPEGAILNFYVVVLVPFDAPTNASGFFTVSARTVNNAGHIAAKYVGFNGSQYGGVDLVGTNFRVDVMLPNRIVTMTASDGMDTISVFDGTKGLRKSRNTIYLDLQSPLMGTGSNNIWYSLDVLADGAGGTNTTDSFVPLSRLSATSLQAVIPESGLVSGNRLSFLVELDGIYYFENDSYLLINLGVQDRYQTVLMNNVFRKGVDTGISLKVPESAIGKSGTLSVYSISGDLIRALEVNTIGSQIYIWDIRDRYNVEVSSGLYFIVLDTADLKEVRKVFIK